MKFQFPSPILSLFVSNMLFGLLYIRRMIQIRQKSPGENWQEIRESFYQSLTSPFDGMWDELVHDHSQLWGIYEEDQIIGYCSKDATGNLTNFFLLENYNHLKTELFKQVLYMLETGKAIVSTNNPDFLVLSLDNSKKMAVHAFLFENSNDVDLAVPEEIKGLNLTPATIQDFQNLMEFCSENTEGDPRWMEAYLNRLIDRQEIHLLKKDGKIIGSCEVRKSLTQPAIADLGVIVDANFRDKGIGSWLMASAKKICLTQGNMPICSCENGNIASRKMIENAGFSPSNMVLKITF